MIVPQFAICTIGIKIVWEKTEKDGLLINIYIKESYVRNRPRGFGGTRRRITPDRPSVIFYTPPDVSTLQHNV